MIPADEVEELTEEEGDLEVAVVLVGSIVAPVAEDEEREGQIHVLQDFLVADLAQNAFFRKKFVHADHLRVERVSLVENLILVRVKF